MLSSIDEATSDDKMASHEREDYLDWLDNQSRSPEDCRRLDQRFLGGWLAISATWLVAIMIGFGSLSSLAVVGYCFMHHFARH